MDNTQNKDIGAALGLPNGAAQKVVDQVADTASGMVDRIRSTADYVRNNDVKAMGKDVEALVKRYPGQALIAAALLGFFVARAMKTRA